MPRAAPFICLIAILQLACGSSRTIRYRLPLAGNPGADVCYAGCQDVRKARGDDAFLECLAECPGTEQTADARCDRTSEGDQPPVAMCVTARAPAGNPATGYLLTTIIVAVVILLGIGFLVITQDDTAF